MATVVGIMACYNDHAQQLLPRPDVTMSAQGGPSESGTTKNGPYDRRTPCMCTGQLWRRRLMRKQCTARKKCSKVFAQSREDWVGHGVSQRSVGRRLRQAQGGWAQCRKARASTRRTDVWIFNHLLSRLVEEKMRTIRAKMGNIE